VNPLVQTSRQQDEEKTEPGVNRKVAVDGQRFGSRKTYGCFHMKDQNTAIAQMTRPTQTGSSSRRRRRRSASEINIDWKPLSLPKMPYLYPTGGSGAQVSVVHHNRTVPITHVQKVRVVGIHSSHVQISHVQGGRLAPLASCLAPDCPFDTLEERCALDRDFCD